MAAVFPGMAARIPLTDQQRNEVGRELQATLVELVDLALQGKQAHWNVIGPLFHPVHELLDTFVEQYRAWSDRVAERLTAIGLHPDGQAGAVTQATPLTPFPAGPLRDAEVVSGFCDRVAMVAANVRQRMDRVGDHDSATQNMLQELVTVLEKQLWMLRVQTL